MSFSYESIYKKDSWKLALFFPAKGEEFIHIVRPSSDEIQILGSLKLNHSIKESLKKTLSFIDMAKAKKLDCSLGHDQEFYSGTCKLKSDELSLEGKRGSYFKLKWNDKIFGGSFLGEYFKKLEIVVGKETTYQRPEFKLELYVDQCHN